MNSRSTRTLSAALAVILVGAAQQLLGYALENETWPGPTIPVVVEMVPPSFTLQDGSLTYNAVVENAMALWNEQVADIQFTWTARANRKFMNAVKPKRLARLKN